MGREIERKFLVKGDFANQATACHRLVQGYLCADPHRSVRVRISNNQGFLTIKGPTNQRGWSRYEFEQPLLLHDAEELLQLCMPGLIDKIRYEVPYGGLLWEVDVFGGDNEGLVVAELELASEDDVFDCPEWVGDEVTGDTRYYNAMLAKHPYAAW